MPISRLLIANRGEIARRIIRSCHDLDIESVAVFSDADADAAFVAEADLSVHLPGTSAAQTYLDVASLLAAASRAGADALHPGYGFLSENADFARVVVDAGLTWVGPPTEAIAAMGSKVEAKALMKEAGVPVLERLAPSEVGADDLPVLVKADAGGGGRGMRIVRDLDVLDSEIASAEREAASAFGDPTVFCEPYLERGHHVEVQILADAEGRVWSLGERDCSVQRRHQKVVEEAPSPIVDVERRAELEEAARSAAAAIGYVGAGTVEFIMTEDGRFWFLEMNTRLQVEHPVTECVTGLDLVTAQLRIADGEPLGEVPPPVRGHAVEARLYAEDPQEDWSPQHGIVDRFEIDADREFRVLDRPGIRLDAGVRSGDVITVHYDAMIAKVIAWAPTREEALRLLARSLRRARLHGPVTNRDLLIRVLRSPEFLAGRMDTGYLERPEGKVLLQPRLDGASVDIAAVAASLVEAERHRARAAVVPAASAGWRNVRSQPQIRGYRIGERLIEARYVRTPAGISLPDLPDVVVVSAGTDAAVLESDGVRRRWLVDIVDDRIHVDGPEGSVSFRREPRFPDPENQRAVGSLVAPLPGSVVEVFVAEAQTVTADQPLMVLEAMKMQHTITAPAAGVVATISVTVGSQVEAGELLAVVSDPDED